MSVGMEKILKNIDAVLEEYSLYHYKVGYTSTSERHMGIYALLISTIQNYAPKNSSIYNNTTLIIRNVKDISKNSEIYYANVHLAGILQALKSVYEKDILSSIQELIHADLFGDFLDMSEYLLSEGYKDAAAVMAGGVLEEHLRKLCLKQGIEIVKNDGKSVKAEQMNSNLYTTGVYKKGDNKSITAWLDLRNNAAHGNYTEYTDKQVELMLRSLQDFINRYSA